MAWRRLRSGDLVLVVALSAVGSLVGSALSPRVASGCQCETATWNLALVSDQASDSAQAHDAYWPKKAVLVSSPGYVVVGNLSHEPGVVGRAGVGP